MTNISDDIKKDTIYNNFLNTQDMIKFAETKNAAIIASSGAVIALVFDKLSFDNLIQNIFFTGYIFIALALTISFWSLWPITHTKEIKRKNIKTKEVDRNLFLFTDIAFFKTYKDFEKAISVKYYFSQELTSIEKDVLSQIYTNSNIALRKHSLFKLSLLLFFIGILLMLFFGPFL